MSGFRIFEQNAFLTPGISLVLLRFVQDLNARYRGIVLDGLKQELQLPFLGGLEMIEGLRQSLETAGLFIDIEVVEKELAIATHTKHPAAYASFSPFGAEIKLGKVQHDRVTIA